MSYEEIALYISPPDPVAFDHHYQTVHAKLAKQLPGLLEYTAFHPSPAATNPLGVYMVAHVTFADEAAYMAAVRSPIGQRLEADMFNFGSTQVTILSGGATPF